MKNKITPWDILNYSLQNIFFKGIEVDIAGVQKSEETIANFQWFLRRPLPLNVFWAVWPLPSMVLRWFLMLLPSLSMVFDGSGPLVNRCDGFDGSLWSHTDHEFNCFTLKRWNSIHIFGSSILGFVILVDFSLRKVLSPTTAAIILLLILRRSWERGLCAVAYKHILQFSIQTLMHLNFKPVNFFCFIFFSWGEF